jgi:hypothetical protein
MIKWLIPGFKVQVGSTFSESHHQEQGMAQGSILSVTLLDLTVNNNTKILNSCVDCSICKRFSNMLSAKRMQTMELNFNAI